MALTKPKKKDGKPTTRSARSSDGAEAPTSSRTRSKSTPEVVTTPPTRKNQGRKLSSPASQAAATSIGSKRAAKTCTNETGEPTPLTKPSGKKPAVKPSRGRIVSDAVSRAVRQKRKASVLEQVEASDEDEDDGDEDEESDGGTSKQKWKPEEEQLLLETYDSAKTGPRKFTEDQILKIFNGKMLEKGFNERSIRACRSQIQRLVETNKSYKYSSEQKRFLLNSKTQGLPPKIAGQRYEEERHKHEPVWSRREPKLIGQFIRRTSPANANKRAGSSAATAKVSSCWTGFEDGQLRAWFEHSHEQLMEDQLRLEELLKTRGVPYCFRSLPAIKSRIAELKNRDGYVKPQAKSSQGAHKLGKKRSSTPNESTKTKKKHKSGLPNDATHAGMGNTTPRSDCMSFQELLRESTSDPVAKQSVEPSGSVGHKVEDIMAASTIAALAVSDIGNDVGFHADNASLDGEATGADGSDAADGTTDEVAPLEMLIETVEELSPLDRACDELAGQAREPPDEERLLAAPDAVPMSSDDTVDRRIEEGGADPGREAKAKANGKAEVEAKAKAEAELWSSNRPWSYGMCSERQCCLKFDALHPRYTHTGTCRHWTYLQRTQVSLTDFHGTGDYRLALALSTHMEVVWAMDPSRTQEERETSTWSSVRIRAFAPLDMCFEEWSGESSFNQPRLAFTRMTGLFPSVNLDNASNWDFGELRLKHEGYTSDAPAVLVNHNCWLFVTSLTLERFSSERPQLQWKKLGNLQNYVHRFTGIERAALYPLARLMATRTCGLKRRGKQELDRIVSSPLYAYFKNELDEDQFKVLHGLLLMTGIILNDGPFGCGKTTTLSACAVAFVLFFSGVITRFLQVFYDIDLVARREHGEDYLWDLDFSRELGITRHRSNRVRWLGVENEGGRGDQTYNMTEVAVVILLVLKIKAEFRKRDLPNKRVLVVTPHRFHNKWVKTELNRLRDLFAAYVDVRVKTSDSSQGSEADVVIVSFTRYETTGFLGGHPERTLVSLSRAKDYLFMLGKRQVF